MNKRLGCAVPTIAAMLSIVGCASTPTTLDAQWVNPDFAGRHAVRNLMVMTTVRDSTNRRLFEDRMVAVLKGAGVTAVQSYKFIPEEGPVAQDVLRTTLARAGVQHAMVTSIVSVSTQINASPGMVMGPAWGPGWGWGGGWGAGWGGFAGYQGAMWATAVPPQVWTTQNVNADTRLFDAGDAAVQWSAATTTSSGYASVPQMIDQFVQLIVGAMAKDGII